MCSWNIWAILIWKIFLVYLNLQLQQASCFFSGSTDHQDDLVCTGCSQGQQNRICSWCLPALCFFRFQSVLQAGVFPVSVFVCCLFLSLILHLPPSYFLFLPPPLPLFSSSPLFLLFSCLFLVLCFESEMPPTGSYFECSALSALMMAAWSFRGGAKAGQQEETLKVAQASSSDQLTLCFLPAVMWRSSPTIPLTGAEPPWGTEKSLWSHESKIHPHTLQLFCPIFWYSPWINNPVSDAVTENKTKPKNQHIISYSPWLAVSTICLFFEHKKGLKCIFFLAVYIFPVHIWKVLFKSQLHLILINPVSTYQKGWRHDSPPCSPGLGQESVKELSANAPPELSWAAEYDHHHHHLSGHFYLQRAGDGFVSSRPPETTSCYPRPLQASDEQGNSPLS